MENLKVTDGLIKAAILMEDPTKVMPILDSSPGIGVHNTFMIRKGKNVLIAYDLTVNGRLIKSIAPERPFRYIQGEKQLFLGFENALRGMKVGDKKEIRLSPKNGYGKINSKSMIEMPKSKFPTRYHFVGKEVPLKKLTFPATVKEVRKTTLVLDLNHPFAGKEMRYSVFVIGIQGEGKIELKRGDNEVIRW